MTQNEKFRALLKETQYTLAKISSLNGTRAGMLYEVIDAALAEPAEDFEASASRGWEMADSLHLSVKEQRERAEKAEAEAAYYQRVLEAIASRLEMADLVLLGQQ
jgi:hypothetical protein